MKHRITLIIVVLLALVVPAAAQTGTFLDRNLPTDIRVADYNVNWDSIFPDDDPDNSSLRCCNKVAEFRRVIAAINPDIMCLQEIDSGRPASDVTAIFDEVLPLPGGALWQGRIGYDVVTVSRWPLTMFATQTVPAGDLPQCMTLVDLPATYPRDFYVMGQHFKCCTGSTNDARRQKQADAIVNWMRDARTAGGFINLPAGTPMLVMGDFNIVGSTNPLTTLLCGNIVDNATYGADSPPDWNGTCSTDPVPTHNVTGFQAYTWRDDTSGFTPSRLDYVIYTDSAVGIAKKMVLNTVSMTAADRTATGLQSNDIVLEPPGRYDHLPVVIDFRFAPTPTPDGDVNLDGAVDGRDVDWFVALVIAGAAGDPARIPHGDFNASGIVDTNDVSGFVGVLLVP